MRFLAVLIIGATLAGPALAREIDPAERRELPYDTVIPACDNANVLGEIANRFQTTEYRFWNSGLQILAFERVRQVAWRPWGLDFIPRRFCSGVVVTSDGARRRIDFSVREDLSFIGASWGTEWCIDGLDRHYAYAPRCKQAQP
jgi:hypothetical protein